MTENHLPELNQEHTMPNVATHWYWKGFFIVIAFGGFIYFFRRPFFRYLRNLKDIKKKINKEGLHSKTVQIFIPVKTPTTDKFRSEISTLCEKFSYECILCDDIGMLLEKFPLIVVCTISSRFEPDIDYAIDGIHWKKPFVVLLLHTGLESSLPRLSTASKLAHKEKYKNIEFIDIAYNMDANLYPCEMNETARIKLKTFLFDFAGNK